MHDLGRSLLLMIRDDYIGGQFPQAQQHFVAPVDPFAIIRGRLAAMDVAFQSLHAHVDGFPSALAAQMRCVSPATAVCYVQGLLPSQYLAMKIMSPIPRLEVFHTTPITAASPCWFLRPIVCVWPFAV